MKVMIAYDGSTYAGAALDDLRRAGLPREAEALVVSVGDGLMSTSLPIAEVAGTALTSRRVLSAIAVATRAWPEGREVRLVVVDDGSALTRADDVRPRLDEMFTRGDEAPPFDAHLMAEGARMVLADAGLGASVEVRAGDPRRVLADRAWRWSADSIFVGSHGSGSHGESTGLGGVASALVTDSACSVEVVRPDGPRRRRDWKI